jgi:hypothetical protein
MKPTRRLLPGSEVEFGDLGFGAQLAFALEHQRQTAAGGARHHHPAADVLGEPGHRAFAALTHRHHALDVADAGRQTQDHRHLEALGEFEGGQREVMRFLRIGRFEQRHMGKATPVARILLVLRRGQADVVGDGDHQAAADAGQGHRHQRVGSDVHADMLHRAEAARTGHRRAESDFERDLLVDRPLAVKVGIAGQTFEHLGRRRPRIGGRDAHPRFPHGARHGLVAGHQQPARLLPSAGLTSLLLRSLLLLARKKVLRDKT